MTGRQKVLDAIEKVKAELVLQKEFFVGQMKLIEAQRIEQRTPVRSRDDDRDRFLQGGSRTTRVICRDAARANRRRR